MEFEHFDPQDVRAALAELLASEQFRANAKRANFLTYVVEKTLNGNALDVKGYSIGVDVFERPKDFDPQADPIVRLEAGRLRRELEHYYLTDGIDALIEIEIPKGTYVPVFKLRGSATNSEQNEESEPRGLWPSQVRFKKNGRQKGSLLFLVGILSGICIAVFAFSSADYLKGRSSNQTAQSEVAAQGKTNTVKLYISPFVPLLAEQDTTAFALGLTNEIAGKLAMFPEVAVYPVSADFEEEVLSGAGQSRASSIEYMLSGSTRVEGPKVQVYAYLRNAGDGRQIWSEEFEVDYKPALVFDLQDSITNSVARKLAEPFGILRTSISKQLRQQFDPSLEHYRCVLLGYEYRRAFAEEDHFAARDCLEKTTAEAPDYARAWALLTYLYVDEIRLFYNTKPNPSRRALDAARRAVELAPEDPLSYQALSVAEFTIGNIENGLEAAKRAISLNNHNYEALWQLGFRTWLAGDYEEGAAIAQRAIEESPTHPSWYYWVIVAEKYRQGEFEEALRLVNRIEQTELVFIEALRTMIYGQLGQAAKAEASMQRLRKLDPQFDLRAREWFSTHQMQNDVLDLFEEGLMKAGLKV